jgi:hypothetical protein
MTSELRLHSKQAFLRKNGEMEAQKGLYTNGQAVLYAFPFSSLPK